MSATTGSGTTALRNWAGNHRYRARELHRPATVEQVQDVLSRAEQVHVLGSRHSFNAVADAAELVSLDALPAGIVVDRDATTVTCGGAVRYGELAAHLDDEGLALHNLASLPHISVAGAVATATHGSGARNGNLATAVAALQLVTSSGEVVELRRGDPDFAGAVVGLGALGAVTRVTLDVQPVFEVRQHVFEGLGWSALYEHFDEVMSSGYSVSAFTRFGAATNTVWVKTRTDEPAPGDLFGAAPAAVERHPIIGLDPVHCTPQLGRPGRWSDRLPHFRMGFTPSAGDELQSEYLLPRRHAVAAIEAVRGLADRIRPLLLVNEIRTVAADGLWMSTSQGHDSVALHFTWRQEQDAVEDLLVALEDALAPFDVRPHWGKLFRADAPALAPRYERHGDFVRLVERLDPRGAFRTDWLERHVLGA